MIGNENVWKEPACIRRAKSVLDLYAIKALSKIANGSREESGEKKREAAHALIGQSPAAEFVFMESAEDESGSTDYVFHPEMYLGVASF